MKKVYILLCLVACGAFVSCTNDDETSDKKTTNEVKKEISPVPSYADGPGDDPIIVPPPPTKD